MWLFVAQGLATPAIRDMKNFNSSQFLNELENNTSDLLKQPFDNANNLANAFISMYQTIVNKHAPIKFLNKKQQKLRMKPWITPMGVARGGDRPP